MTRILTLCAVVGAFALTACSEKRATDAMTSSRAQTGSSVAAAAPAAAAPAASKPAAYMPNLKPGEIVWDSPEKKAAWEKRKADIAALQK